MAVLSAFAITVVFLDGLSYKEVESNDTNFAILFTTLIQSSDPYRQVAVTG